MASNPECGCGCGTPLKQRKDGTYANYAPGGHDAKHKSALVKAARDGDKQALKILKEKGWEKFLEKAKKKTAHERKQVVKKSTKVKPMFYGLSEFDFGLLKNPPTTLTWYCDSDHSGEGPMMVSGTSDFCWFCHEGRRDNSRLVWPEFEAARERLIEQDWERIRHDARIDERLSMMSRPDSVTVAREMLKLRVRYIENADVEGLKEEDGTVYA